MTLKLRAEAARKQLFERYDRLNALWGKAEERLTAHHIPKVVQCDYAEYPIDEFDPQAGYESCALGLMKVKGKWRICHGFYHNWSMPGPSEWMPIVECSAEIRVEAAEHLHKLEEATVKSAELFIPRVDKAIEALEHALEQPNKLADMSELLAERARLNGQTE